MSDPFRTRDHVANFDDLVRAYAERSAETRARRRAVLGLAYGPGRDERLDLFLPPEASEQAPVHVFVHGGYWRMFGRDDFSFVAETALAAGALVAVVDYSLMPGVRLGQIVDQVRRAVGWVAANARRHGGDPAALSVSGHSAGAQLCCWLLDGGYPGPPIRSALLLGGVYDLEPLRTSFLRELIGLTEEEVRLWSPLGATLKTAAEVSILVGARETAPFHEQAGRMAERFAAQGVSARLDTLDAEDHMSAALALGEPDSAAGRELRRIIRAAAERQARG